jgi:hypothetical protein
MTYRPLAAKTPGLTYIAGWKTIEDWMALRPTLVPGSVAELWQTAFTEYFYERLSSRYLEPIGVLQDSGTFQGEGFSIVAIQCSLIEFLESTVQGLSYRYRRRNDPPLGPHEYSGSGDIFVQFLSTRQPFATDFTRDTARDFYENVRCGLLHEARTKNGWTIWANSPTQTVANTVDKIVYRNDFQAAIIKFIEWYEQSLRSDAKMQEAFLRKFDSLCQ